MSAKGNIRTVGALSIENIRERGDGMPVRLRSKANWAGDCLIWSACVGGDGYGHFRHNGYVRSAHRVAFEVSVGRPPRGHVLHSCDNPLCINPDHLSEGTHKENMSQCASRGRGKTPRSGNGYTKLTQDDLREIKSRHAAGETNKSAIAREYGVTPTRVRQVING